MTRSVVRVTVALLLVLLTACPPPAKNGKGGGAGVNAEACGNISVSKVGRKLYSFLKASAELDAATIEMEGSVKTACKRMAKELGVSTAGDTKTVCDTALKALDANLEISVKTESRLVTRTVPPVCTTDIDFTASFAAECEASVAADIDVRCEGSCGGTCSGACEGECQGDNAGGECNGVCQGECKGSCSADCDGYAHVDASVECTASAELSASIHTTCTEPRVEVVREDVTVVDDTKFQAAMAAIDAGLPALLSVGAKAKLVGKAMVAWAETLGSLIQASGQLLDDLGDKGLCVIGQLTAAFAAVANVQARVEVSIDVSASFSASAGAQEQ